MFNLYQVDLSKEPTLIETYEDGQEAVNGILEIWHEEDEANLFVVYEDDKVWATIMRGTDVNDATVCRNGGASQRFNVVYNTDKNGRYESTTVKSL